MGSQCTLMVALEQHFVKAGDTVYTDVQCSSDFWDRYLRVFDHVVVCARMRDVVEDDNLDGMLVSSRPDVSFVALPDFRGARGTAQHYLEARKVIWKLAQRVDAVLFRVPNPIAALVYPLVVRSGLPFACEMNMNPRTAYGKGAIPASPALRHLLVAMTKRICMSANGVAYVTRAALQDEYPCRAMEGESATYFTSSYSTVDLPRECYRKRDWGEGAPSPVILVHVGVMADGRKGHTTFIDTVAELRARGHDVRGLLIGDGPCRVQLEGYARKSGVADLCEFVGWKTGFSEVQEQLLRASHQGRRFATCRDRRDGIGAHLPIKPRGWHPRTARGGMPLRRQLLHIVCL